MSIAKRPPSYRLHKARNCAVVTIDGKNHYLGAFGSAESHEKYARLIAEWRSNKSVYVDPSPSSISSQNLLVGELILAYWKHVETYYVKDGEPTSEVEIIRQALRRVRRLHSTLPVSEFGPTALKAIRDELAREKIVRRNNKQNCQKRADNFRKDGKTISRGVINRYINKIRAMFRWGVEAELVSSSVYEALRAVAALRKGRTDARETDPVPPVPDAHVDAVLPKLSPVVAAMVRIQRLTGARPQEVVNLRPCEIEKRDDGVWLYRPGRHKTEHHGRQRIIVLGPKAQEVLTPWLDRDQEQYCFSPKEADEWRKIQRRAKAKRVATPAKTKPKKSRKPRPPIGDHYTRHSYRVAIQRACRRAKVPVWSPNRLRHTRATELRAKYGLEAARTILGHSEVNTTEIYAERDLGLAMRVSLESG